jgi:hypothetical protein
MTICNRLSSAFALCVLLSAPCAHAQAEDQAAARSLFDEGRKLLKARNYTDACPKLEAASKLYASAGILLNLGDCYEKVGRTASAWTEFGESAAAADRASRHDQEAEARKRQAAIEPRLSRLAIRVPHEIRGLVVTRDGSELAAAAFGSAIPVDPGPHEIHAQAAGHEPWTTSVSVTAPGQTVSVDVPELTASAVAATAPVAAVSGDADRSTAVTTAPLAEPPPEKPRSRALGYALLGGGVAVGAGGLVLMLVEAGRASQSRSDDTPGNSPASVSKYNSTKAPYYVGLAGTVAGGLAAAAGVVVLVAPSHGSASAATAVRATPWVGAGAGGVELGGAW